MKTFMLGIALGVASFGVSAELNKLEQDVLNACYEVSAQDIDLCVSNTKSFIGVAYNSGYTMGMCHDVQAVDTKAGCTSDLYTNEDMNNLQDIADNISTQKPLVVIPRLTKVLVDFLFD